VETFESYVSLEFLDERKDVHLWRPASFFINLYG